jgi:redox-sensing transcriptional repressor
MPAGEKSIPASVVSRLTRYLAHVQSLQDRGAEWVSSQGLGDALGLTPSTVRQDLSHVDFSGISKRGYETAGLERVLSHLLGADKQWRAIVVGAGNLGRALVLHEEFERRGFEICAVFDSDRRKAGHRLGRHIVLEMDALEDTVRKGHVDIGIIAVPAAAAQDVAERLVKAGVKGLLNLALTHISVTERVAVVDSRVVASLQELTYRVQFG